MSLLAPLRRDADGRDLVVGMAAPTDRELQAPASGIPCVFWRLRIHETVAPAVTLVHDVTSEEPFQIAWQGDPENPGRTLRVPAAEARVRAATLLHREGSPGALAVTRAFGLVGQVRVEESFLRTGERVEARGVALSPDRSGGPFRDVAGPTDLLDADVRVLLQRGSPLVPVLIGAGAIVFGVLGSVLALGRILDQGRALIAPRELRIFMAPRFERPVPARPDWP